MAILDDIYQATATGNYKGIKALVKEAIDGGTAPHDIVNKSLSAAMIEVGDKFGSGELYMPDMLLAAKAMQTAMEEIKPLLKGKEAMLEKGTVVIGTVKGDLHDIGKNLVITMAEGQGFKIVDLGIDVDPIKFVDAVKEYKPQIVAFSGLLTTTLGNIPEHIKALEDAGVRDKVVLAVGGAPVTRDFADRYGIEIYADDASGAAKEFLKVVEN
ncbi:MAG: corrinoid protein [Actinobacteria bacterium]|jgi:5-methyltetrahydrofolate--homocysteine methyltransferase|nr:corrinoid protein [Actinomycetota bacterium]